MKILVTGESGQLARSLVERVRLHPDFELTTVGRPAVDLERAGSAAEVIKAVKPDIVINAAAYTAVDQAEDESERAFKINAEGAGEVAAAAASVGASIVQISTDYVFDGQSNQPYDEAAATNPISVYGRSKLAGEEAVRESNGRHTIVRTAWVYSPFGRNFVSSIVSAAATRPELFVVSDQRGCPTSALDLADGVLALISSAQFRGEVFHLAGNGAASWFEFATEIMEQCALFGKPNVPVRPIFTDDWPTRAARPRNSVLNGEKFERLVGFAMPDWRSSVAEVIRRM